MTDYPRLSNLMGAYFNQDYDVHGDSDEDILKDYSKGHWPAENEDTVRELERLLATPLDGLLERFKDATGHDNMIIGESDTEAFEWLCNSLAVLKRNLVNDQMK